MREKHMFGGVNSPKGFYSRFNHIISEVPGTRKIFIKGGPGMGKSTLMKRVANRAKEEGLFCELFHCSSDPSSLDGVHVPELKTAIIDATPPHNSDPLYPCTGSELFDVSKHVEKELSYAAMDALLYYTEQKKKSFVKGYHFLQAALPLIRQMDSVYSAGTDFREITEAAEKLAQRVLGNTKTEGKKELRELFISAITPDGFVNFADDFFADTYCIALKGNFGSSVFIRRFIEFAKTRGYMPLVFYCPMRPDEKIEHIFIPELAFSLVTYDDFVKPSFDEVIQLDVYMDDISETEECLACSGTLFRRAIDSFAEAKKAHVFLENIYVPCMNFDSLEEQTDKMIKSIF